MSSIILVAETGSDITPELALQYNIQMVPMHVNFGEETLDDGSFHPQKIVEYYQQSGKLPKTSGCTPEDFVKIFDEIQILYLAYSAITTCSYQSAMIAAEGREYITLLDTKQVSVGQGNVVIAMAEILKDNPNMNMDEAVHAAKDLIARAKFSSPLRRNAHGRKNLLSFLAIWIREI